MRRVAAIVGSVVGLAAVAPAEAATITFGMSWGGATMSAQFEAPDSALDGPITGSEMTAFTMDFRYRGATYQFFGPQPGDSVTLTLDASGSAIATWDILVQRATPEQTTGYVFDGNNTDDGGYAQFAALNQDFDVMATPAPPFTSSVTPSVAPVPLPGALGLLVAGLGAAGLALRRGRAARRIEGAMA